MAELLPDLQVVQDSFMTNYAIGGIEACRTMVADLAQEASLIGAVADGADVIDAETAELQTVIPPEEVIDRLEMTSGVIRDHNKAMSRHSFALFLLGIVDTDPTG